MNDALHAAASAMSTRMRALDTSSQNMVNAMTPGYLSRLHVNHSFATALDQEFDRAPSMVHAKEQLSFRQGRFIPSDNETALAIDGEGFFTINTPSGLAYTRNGDFMTGRDGTIQTRAGYPVLDEAGNPIVADPNAGPVTSGNGGAFFQGNVEIGRAAVVRFEDQSVLEPVAETILRAPDGVAGTPANDTRVATGMIEVPHDNAMTSMVAMIAANHQFEAAQRVMSTVNRSYQQLNGGNSR